MASVTVTGLQAGLAGFVATDPEVDSTFYGWANQVAAEAAQLAPRRTGRLASSIKARQSRDASGRFAPGYEVVVDVDYAQPVIHGSRPHPIRGNPLLAFHWERVGRFVVLPQVHHPGTAPNDFLTRALQAIPV